MRQATAGWPLPLGTGDAGLASGAPFIFYFYRLSEVINRSHYHYDHIFN